MSTTIIGFPRLGEFRELKFTTEKYFRKEISEEELLAAAKELRAKHWNICLLYTSPSPRDMRRSRMPSSA